jgi:hypothetical protein
MKRAIEHGNTATRQHGNTATTLRSRAAARQWLTTTAYEVVALDPARWSDRAKQVAYWSVYESWYRSRPLH